MVPGPIKFGSRPNRTGLRAEITGEVNLLLLRNTTTTNKSGGNRLEGKERQMNTTAIKQQLGARALKCTSAVIALTILALTSIVQAAPRIYPVNSMPYGKTYSQWSADWWQWGLSQPVDGHPFVDDPSFDVTAGQCGPVWFLTTPLGTVERHVAIPAGKSLFVGLLNAEASDLEGLGSTKTERRETANFLADHIVSVSCAIDGETVANMDRYRVTSPQFSFVAPTPWIFGETGGRGKSVGDGYYLMLAPLTRGTHTITIGGEFHFSVAEGDPFDFDASADVTYHITVY